MCVCACVRACVSARACVFVLEYLVFRGAKVQRPARQESSVYASVHSIYFTDTRPLCWRGGGGGGERSLYLIGTACVSTPPPPPHTHTHAGLGIREADGMHTCSQSGSFPTPPQNLFVGVYTGGTSVYNLFVGAYTGTSVYNLFVGAYTGTSVYNLFVGAYTGTSVYNLFVGAYTGETSAYSPMRRTLPVPSPPRV